VSLAVHGKWIIHLPFLQKGEPNAIVAVLSRVEPRLFAPKEVPEQRQFYFVHSGVVLYAARVLTAGTAWGEDFILESKCFFSGYVAYAMTHVEVYKLTRPQMLEALATFPVALRAMRKQALLAALRHAMTRAIRARRAEESREKVMLSSKGERDFVNVTLSAVAKREAMLAELANESYVENAAHAQVQARRVRKGPGESEISAPDFAALRDDIGHLRTQATEQRQMLANLSSQNFTVLRDDVAHLRAEATETRQQMANMRLMSANTWKQVAEMKLAVSELADALRFQNRGIISPSGSSATSCSSTPAAPRSFNDMTLNKMRI